MPIAHPQLVPAPQSIELSSERICLPIEHQPTVSRNEAAFPNRAEGAYRLEINAEGCQITANSPTGAAYALQTFKQLRKFYGEQFPHLQITDWPDYPTRGLYHDITRGKVPTLQTLKLLADYCAELKLNQLQLYIEHTYAYTQFTEIWQNADPLTKAEILEFDSYCAERHIELVPSFSTFGHLYPFIHTPRFQHLNELDRDVSTEPFSWYDRMQHYTLDCQNPESIQLVRTLIEEVHPLFRSKQFNICADETFDLGRGKNKPLADKVGKGRLYIDFVNQVLAIVKECGSVPMMWGDVVHHHLDLLPELPKDLVMLDWDYTTDLSTSIAQALNAAGATFYVCSGITAWNNFFADHDTAEANIVKFAAHGHKHGATGYLVTDWGDYGHINPLTASLPGIALAADCAWNVANCEATSEARETRISKAIFGDPTGELFTLLHAAGTASKLDWQALSYWQQGVSKNLEAKGYAAERHLIAPETGKLNAKYKHSIDEHLAARDTLRTLEARTHAVLQDATPAEPFSAEEITLSFQGAIIFEEVLLALFHAAGRNPDALPIDSPKQVAKKVRTLEKDWRKTWLTRNKLSEFDRIADMLHGIADHLEGE